MIQTLQKLCQTGEHRLRDLLMKHTGLFCFSAALVGAGVAFVSYGHERTQAAIYAAGAILASFIALNQWASGRCVKRAELVDRLIEKISTIEPSSLMEECGSGNVRELEKQDQDFSAKLSFLSYIAYLEATGILSDDEFNALRLDLVRILENEWVSDMIKDACDGSKDSKYIPYSYLVRYGAANCKSKAAGRYREILDSRNAQTHDEVVPGRDGVLDSVGSGKTYGTHVEVLNGIFKFSYRAHMRGCATLPDGRVVWFPKYDDSAKRGQIKVPTAEWVNILDSEKGVIFEYWPSGVEMTDERLNRWNREPRYVFGMNKSESPSAYRFLGIYRLEGRKENHLVYKRQNVDLRWDEVENSLNPDNY